MSALKYVEIYALELLETRQVSKQWWATRVPGGWIFDGVGTAVFVPFDNEFMSDSAEAKK